MEGLRGCSNCRHLVGALEILLRFIHRRIKSGRAPDEKTNKIRPFWGALVVVWLPRCRDGPLGRAPGHVSPRRCRPWRRRRWTSPDVGDGADLPSPSPDGVVGRPGAALDAAEVAAAPRPVHRRARPRRSLSAGSSAPSTRYRKARRQRFADARMEAASGGGGRRALLR
jgi:hypothetical protein